MVNIRKGTHKDLQKYYTMFEVDFDEAELISRFNIHMGMMNGTLELLVFFDDESGMEVGYALCAIKNLYGYVLLKYLGILPWVRGKGMGIQAMRLINKRYAEKQGICAEITEFEDEDKDRVRKLLKFFSRFGYELTNNPYEIAGTKANLMVKGIKGTGDIGPVAHRIMPDFYTRFMPDRTVYDMLTVKPCREE